MREEARPSIPSTLLLNMRPEQLLVDEHFSVELYRNPGIIWVTRLPRAFTSAEDAWQCCQPMLRQLDSLGRKRNSLLFDSRNVAGNNNPEYEEWFAPCRSALIRDFARVAVLVKTTAGRLHSQRLLRADSREDRFRVLDDVGTALDFLMGVSRPNTSSG